MNSLQTLLNWRLITPGVIFQMARKAFIGLIMLPTNWRLKSRGGFVKIQTNKQTRNPCAGRGERVAMAAMHINECRREMLMHCSGVFLLEVIGLLLLARPDVSCSFSPTHGNWTRSSGCERRGGVQSGERRARRHAHLKLTGLTHVHSGV